ncbi:hypothetical protein HKD37_07G019673 [Glycine soja]
MMSFLICLTSQRWKIWWLAATKSTWKLRNYMVFHNQPFDISKLVDSTIFLTWSWLKGWERDFNVPFHQWSSAILITELAPAAVSEKGLTFEEAMEERLCVYSRVVAHFPTAVKEFKWRNGWFCSLSKKATTQGKPDPCHLHSQWLKELRIV